jgi:phosphate transport system substrate-binding protein
VTHVGDTNVCSLTRFNAGDHRHVRNRRCCPRQRQIAGSSTVLPYAAIVAEFFGENTTPAVVESGGSAGLKRFLRRLLGENTIDIIMRHALSKTAKSAILPKMASTDIVEVRIGY